MTLGKADFELNAARMLRQLMPSFPEGKLTPKDPPAPDLIVEGSAPLVGIEVTRFAWDQAKFQEYAFATAIGDAAALEWDRCGLPTAHVALHWARTPSIAGTDLHRFAADLVQKLVTTAGLPRSIPPEGIFLRVDTYWRTLPSQLTSAWIEHREGDRTVFTVAEGGAVPDLSELLPSPQAAVDSKESRVPAYRQHCDEIWLLIVAGFPLGNYLAGEVGATLPTLVSSFDRAFLLREDRPDYVELPLAAAGGVG